MADSNGNRTAGVASIDLIRGVLWPAVVVGVLYYFATPVRDILSVLSANLRSAQSIDLGYVKITVKETKIAPPEKDVGEALSKLDRTLLATLINHSTDSGYNICVAPVDTFAVERKRQYDKLVEFDLARYDSEQDDTYCKGSARVAWLSELGKATKAYFKRIVLEQIAIANPSENSSQNSK